MENRDQFNIESNIENWKSLLTKSKNMTRSNILELENHLLDLMDDLQSKGLNKEESFIIATKRIGKIDDICSEYEKVNTSLLFINSTIPYFKGALFYIAFIVLSKLFLVTALLLSHYLNIDNSTFNIFSVVLLAFSSILFFSVLFFKIKRRKSFLNRLNNVYALATLIVISSIITYRIGAQIVLPGIDISKIGNTSLEYYTMDFNFFIYKIGCGFLLIATTLILFWKNKRNNKLGYIK